MWRSGELPPCGPGPGGPGQAFVAFGPGRAGPGLGPGPKKLRFLMRMTSFVSEQDFHTQNKTCITIQRCCFSGGFRPPLQLLEHVQIHFFVNFRVLGLAINL